MHAYKALSYDDGHMILATKKKSDLIHLKTNK
jgi:hypothetical protein